MTTHFAARLAPPAEDLAQAGPTLRLSDASSYNASRLGLAPLPEAPIAAHRPWRPAPSEPPQPGGLVGPFTRKSYKMPVALCERLAAFAQSRRQFLYVAVCQALDRQLGAPGQTHSPGQPPSDSPLVPKPRAGPRWAPLLQSAARRLLRLFRAARRLLGNYPRQGSNL